MCGGSVEIATCSHVGHVFRKTTPYTFPGGTIRVVNHNNARLAQVWLDQWKDFFYELNPGRTARLEPHCFCFLSFFFFTTTTTSTSFYVRFCFDGMR